MAGLPDNVCFLGRGFVQFRSTASLPRLYRAFCARREVFIGSKQNPFLLGFSGSGLVFLAI